MKINEKRLKFLILGAVFCVFFLIGCQMSNGSDSSASGSVAIQTTDGVRYVKNSLWEGCSLTYLTAKSAARAADATISADELEGIVQDLNEVEDDNQYFVSETDVPIEESPLCNIYIAKKGEIKTTYTDFPRVDLAQMLVYVKADAMALGGCDVYVDKVPPYVPPPEDTRPPEVKYAIFIVNNTDGSILFHEHALEIKPDWWTGTDDAWFYERKRQWLYDLTSGQYPGYHLEAGYEYTIPEPSAEK